MSQNACTCWIVTSVRLTARGGLRASGIQNLLTAIALAEAGHRVVLWVAQLEPGGREAAEVFLGKAMPEKMRLLAYKPQGRAGEKKTPFAPGWRRWVNFVRARLAGGSPDFVLSRSPRALDQLREWGVLGRGARLILEYQYPEWAQLWRGWRKKHPQAGARACVTQLKRLRAAEEKWLGAADGVLYAARAHEELLRRAGFAGRAELLPSACLTPDSENAGRGGRPAEFELGYAGGFERENGIELLLEALAMLPGVRLKVIGGGGEREAAVRELATRLGVAERVMWTGRVPFARVRAEMRACGVGVAPFRASGGPENRRYASPLKVIEWMGAGVPVVAADVPSVREVAAAGALRTVEAESAGALAEGLRALLGDAGEMERLRAAGRDWAERCAYPRRAERIVEFAQR